MLDLLDKIWDDDFKLIVVCISGVFLLILIAAFGPDKLGPEVRVRRTPDGVGLFVDDKRVQPWMLSGLEGGTRSQAIGSEWKKFTFTASQPVDTERCQFHLRCVFPEKLSTIRYRNFSVTAEGKDLFGFSHAFDDEAKLKDNWKMWPTIAMTGWTNYVANGEWVQEVGPIGDKPVRANYVPNSRMFTMKAGVTYTISFEVKSDGVAWIQPNIYAVSPSSAHYRQVMMDSEDFLANQVKLAHNAGVDLVSFLFGGGWVGDGEYDFTHLGATCERILKANPDAMLIPRFGVDAPDAWLKAHPESAMRYDAPSGEMSRYASVASPEYREAAIDYLRELIQYMKAEYPANFAGVHINGQQTHEWFYYDSPTRFHGYDASTIAAFQELPPTVDERKSHLPNGILCNGPSSQKVYNFHRVLQEQLVDFLAQLAFIARDDTEYRKLVIMFYGYNFELATGGTGPGNYGHFGLESLLAKAEGYIDMISAPIPYGDRGWTGVSAEMGTPDTLVRYGVMPMDENDTRTSLDKVTTRRLRTTGETLDVLDRELTQGIMRNVGCWFFDLNGRGWWEEPRFWDKLREYRPLAEQMYTAKTLPEPETALINDENSILRIAAGVSGGKGGWPFITSVRLMPCKAGLDYGTYLLGDVAKNPLKAKLQLFLSSWGVSDENLELLVADRAKTAAMRVWCWAPGWVDDAGRESIERMNRLTGFKFKRVPRAVEEKEKFEPLFTVAEESGMQVLARWSDGSPKLAVKPDGPGQAVFMGRPDYSPKQLQRLAKLAGVHCYLPEASVGKAHTWSREGRVLVQAVSEGKVEVALKRGGVQTLNLRKGECKIITE